MGPCIKRFRSMIYDELVLIELFYIKIHEPYFLTTLWVTLYVLMRLNSYVV